ncbi:MULTISPECIES: alpha-amylase MalA [Haloarcula]|uniref:alpha-amylase MalA n=1 Tax=Haloarcula TaxID=2237 RepID=UPI0023EB531B|nr:alpha-amylase MalA [Halomicroarcula sp. XH51]
MKHPGQPRFAAVGETIELAPRDPNPDATYRWQIHDAPAASDVTLGDDPVLSFTPDAAGTYTVVLSGPTGDHELTVRVFPAETSVGGLASGQSGISGVSGVSGQSGLSGQWSGGVSGSARGSGLGTDSDDQRGRPRIQLSGGVRGDDVVVEATVKTSPNSEATDETLDVEFVVDDRDPEPAGFETSDREARAPLENVEESFRVHAVAVGEQYSVPDAVRVHPDGEVELLNDPPEWGTEMSLYEVYVRGYKEGDEDQSVFEVIQDNLGEIQDNGVDTLWLTPVLQHDGFDHGYNITDFYSVADDLGTEAEFADLVDAAHDRGMKVLFDLVLNHSAREHPYFQKAQAGDPEYRDWYEWEADGSPGTYFDWEYIANFDYTNLEVRRHLLDAVDKWAEYVDGFRCDMAWAVPTPFWQEIRERVKADYPDFVLLDETIPYIADFHNLAFDIHFDTTLYFTLRQIGRGEADADDVLDALEQRAVTGFPDHAGFMLYIENHDETRYVEECGREALEAAAAAQFTLPGVPMLYAGQEIGERNRRGEIYWEHAQEDLREYYQDLTYTRNTIPALQYAGDYEEIAYQCDDDKVTAFAREDDDGNRYVVALNFGDSEATVSFPEEDVEAFDEVHDEDVSAADGDARVENVAVLYAGSE